MLPLNYAVQRIRGILAEIENLEDEDFPYGHSSAALDHIKKLFQERLKSLLDLSASDDAIVVKTACSEALLQQFKSLPLLGFIVRSTNVRNSFEVFGPLLRLARKVIGPEVKLILSSEWQFSPHVYPPRSDLPNYVLLGFPASESGNPLLVPLAGHELGHTTWQTKRLADKFGPDLLKRVFQTAKSRQEEYRSCFEREFNGDLIDRQNLGPAYQWALRQSEETFCDVLGVRIFEVAYLHAFAYLISPGGTGRVPHYPNLQTRIKNLLTAADRLSVKPPDGYSTWFLGDLAPTLTDRERFLLELADDGAAFVLNDVLEHAIRIANESSVPSSSNERIQRVTKAFELLTPAAGIGELTSILSAAWACYYRTDLWAERVLVEQSTELLKEIVLKSIEIAEFEEVMKASDDSEK